MSLQVVDGIPDDDLQPRPSSIEIMETVDTMPKAWRELVYEFGFVPVTAMFDETDDADIAWATLSYQRQLRIQKVV